MSTMLLGEHEHDAFVKADVFWFEHCHLAHPRPGVRQHRGADERLCDSQSVLIRSVGDEVTSHCPNQRADFQSRRRALGAKIVRRDGIR
jgi:hypothetical protein